MLISVFLTVQYVLMVQLLLPQILYVIKNYKADLQEVLQEKCKKSYNSSNILILLLLGFDRVESVLYHSGLLSFLHSAGNILSNQI